MDLNIQHEQLAEANFAASLSAFEPGDARIEAAQTHASWCKILAESGRVDEARAHFDLALTQFEASGLRGEFEQARRSLAAMDGRE